jgi:hypothetical protein
VGRYVASAPVLQPDPRNDSLEELALARVPDPPATKDVLERSVRHTGAQNLIDRIPERRVGLGQHAHVVAYGRRLRLDHEAARAAQ